MTDFKYVSTELSGHVAVVTLSNPPVNFMNMPLLSELQSAFRQLDDDPACRAIVLAAAGKTFCAGADFTSGLAEGIDPGKAVDEFYKVAMTFFDIRKPMVAAVAGAAVGAGFGLALVADFRIACAGTTFSANFNRLGIHPGFGMSVTLPRVVGISNAELLFYTGRRIKGDEAMQMGLLTKLVERDDVLESAKQLAKEIAVSAPIAVQDTKATMRRGLAEEIRTANQHEQTVQAREMQTADFLEGIEAAAERRDPVFRGK